MSNNNDLHTIGQGDDTLVVRRRPMQEGDTPLLFNSWCQQIRRKKPFCGMNDDEFKLYVDSVIRFVVVRADVDVVCPDDDDSVIIGFMCSEADKKLLHYLYIKRKFRREGIARWLMLSRFGSDIGRLPIGLTHPLPYWKHYADKWGLRLHLFNEALRDAQRHGVKP